MNYLRRRRNDADDNSETGSGTDTLKSRKPPNTAFRQQRLKAWQPILTPKSVIPLLFLLAVVFAPLGVVLIYETYNIEKLEIDYSHCARDARSDFMDVPGKYVHHHFRHKNSDPDVRWRLTTATDGVGYNDLTCVIQFSTPRNLEPPIYLYYKLTKFYQNHRKYVELYDVHQLGGEDVSAESLSSNCDPLTTFTDVSGKRKAYYPCGLIANSFFNDSFSSPTLLNTKSGDDNETYVLSERGISWSSDRKHRFKKSTYLPDDVVPPPNWARLFPQGYNSSNFPDLSEWEHLQNWMRTAALPTFYKLYSKNTTMPLSSGTYELEILLNYPVEVFGGSKSLIITTSSILGGRNMSLGIVYFVVAILSLVCALGFFVYHLVKPRRVGDHNFLRENGNSHQRREQL